MRLRGCVGVTMVSPWQLLRACVRVRMLSVIKGKMCLFCGHACSFYHRLPTAVIRFVEFQRALIFFFHQKACPVGRQVSYKALSRRPRVLVLAHAVCDTRRHTNMRKYTPHMKGNPVFFFFRAQTSPEHRSTRGSSDRAYTRKRTPHTAAHTPTRWFNNQNQKM